MHLSSLNGEPRHGTLDGPWRSAFFVDLPFVLRTKSNFRRFRGDSDQWGPLSSFEADVVSSVTPFVPDCWDIGTPGTPVRRRPGVVALIAARTNLDVANYDKSVLDALEGVLYVTDAQVRASVQVGERGSTDQWLSVAFALLAADTPMHDVAVASAELITRWSATRESA